MWLPPPERDFKKMVSPDWMPAAESWPEVTVVEVDAIVVVVEVGAIVIVTAVVLVVEVGAIVVVTVVSCPHSLVQAPQLCWQTLNWLSKRDLHQ